MSDLIFDAIIWFCITSIWFYIGTKVFNISRLMDSLYYDKLKLKSIENYAQITIVLLAMLSIWPLFLIHELFHRWKEK